MGKLKEPYCSWCEQEYYILPQQQQHINIYTVCSRCGSGKSIWSVSDLIQELLRLRRRIKELEKANV